MLKEIYISKITVNPRLNPHESGINNFYMISVTWEEAFEQFSSLHLGKIGKNNPEIDVYNFILSEIFSGIIRKFQENLGGAMRVASPIWKNEQGLGNYIIESIKNLPDWQIRSWLTRLIANSFDPQKHLETAYKLGIVPKNTDPYILREALMGWKKQ